MLSLYKLVTISCWLTQYFLLRCLHQLFLLPSIHSSATPTYSTRSGFLAVFIAILPKLFTFTDYILCIASASYVHVLILTQGPRYPPPGCIPFILANSIMLGPPTMLEDFFYLILFIVIYQCFMWY